MIPEFERAKTVHALLDRVATVIIWRRVVRWKSTDVSEEHVASIFMAEE
jgi:hypothetical protein